MLESHSSGIPEECSGNNSRIQNDLGSTPVEPRGNENEVPGMVVPARVFADAFVGAFYGEDMQD